MRAIFVIDVATNTFGANDVSLTDNNDIVDGRHIRICIFLLGAIIIGIRSPRAGRIPKAVADRIKNTAFYVFSTITDGEDTCILGHIVEGCDTVANGRFAT